MLGMEKRPSVFVTAEYFVPDGSCTAFTVAPGTDAPLASRTTPAIESRGHALGQDRGQRSGTHYAGQAQKDCKHIVTLHGTLQTGSDKPSPSGERAGSIAVRPRDEVPRRV